MRTSNARFWHIHFGYLIIDTKIFCTMKKYLNVLKIAQFIFVVAAASMHIAYAQESSANKKAAKLEAVQTMVDSKNYVFEVQSVTPTSGRTRQLTPYYSLKISGDTLVSQLPYFGRAYVAPIDPTQGGFNFTTTSFIYTVNNRKKGGWDVDIKPNDSNIDVREMALTIFENGSANLIITSNNRQPISYYGYIRQTTDRDKE
jgi:hypothetical protein